MSRIGSDKRNDSCELSSKEKKRTSKYYDITIPLKVLPRSAISTKPSVDIFDVEIHVKK